MSSLADQLAASAQVLAHIEQGKSQSDLLADLGEMRPAVQHFTSAVLRQWGLLRKLRALMLPKPPEPMIAAVIDLGLAGLLEDQGARNEFTVVDEAVSAIGRLYRQAGPASLKAKKGLANAILRRFLRERKTLLDQARLDPEALHNLPSWWVDAVKRDYRQDAGSIFEAQRSHAPMTLRVNLAKQSLEEAQAALQKQDLRGQVIGPSAIRLDTPCSVDQIPGFAQGAFSVQDLGAQLAAPLLLGACEEALKHSAKFRLLDACAAPGGKTGHVLEWFTKAQQSHAKLVAMDSDSTRLEKVVSNVSRLNLGLPVESLLAVCADAGDTRTWPGARVNQAFDAMLLDVPCSASGIASRHPDIPWLRRRGDIATLGVQQARLLHALWPLLAPGGTLLYVTCSIFPQENDAIVQAFSSRTADCQRLPTLAPEGHSSLCAQSVSGDLGLQLLPTKGQHDGFYYALLRKAR